MEIAEDSGLRMRDLRLDAAAGRSGCLHRLGDAVAADLLRAVARHQPDDQAADDGDGDRKRSRVAATGTSRSRRRRNRRGW